MRNEANGLRRGGILSEWILSDWIFIFEMVDGDASNIRQND